MSSRKVGVLASRSPHRPNPIGLSAVRLDHVDLNANGGPELHVSGLDLINGTPILDIKPYIDYADSIPNTVSGWASQPIEKISITFSHEAELTLSQIEQNDDTKSLRHLIHDVLELDPRPAFQKRKIPVSDPSSQGARFGIELVDYEVKYEIANAGFTITKIETKSESS